MPNQYIDIHIVSNGGNGITAGVPLRQALPPAAKEVVGALSDGKLFGLEDPVYQSGKYELLTMDHPRAMELFWHSSSHLLAQAVKRLFPHAKLGIGPAIKEGFYYDFDFGEQISSEDLEKIEAEMAKIVAENLTIKRAELTPEEARKFFAQQNATYKLELIEGITEQISTYTQGEFTDLCRGPHIPSTGMLKHFKLLSLTGAYWRGDERNAMLQRIYGTSFPSKKLLDEHLARIEEAKKRDHRIIGKNLDLFSFHPEAPGAPFWHRKGAVLFGLVKDYMRHMLLKRGYSEVVTPLILTEDLWRRSGHWDHYEKNMYFTSQEDRDYAVKPMNCPGHVVLYQDRQWSYRDLPQRWMEMGIVHRYEKSGTLHGLFRVRHITQDDAHIFCTPDQAVDEVRELVRLVFDVMNHFGLKDIRMELSTRPKDRIGADELWDKAETALAQALNEEQKAFDLNEGEGAFYGPKIDFHVSDSLGRSWQLSTIQFDFNFPERFALEFVGADNTPSRPVMLHRAILGSLERFIGILIEHYAGDFPLWLSPVQAIILPITDSQNDVAYNLRDKLLKEGIRIEIDSRNEKIGKKIREAELQKIPYMMVIGAREAESGQVSVRRRTEGDLGVMSADEILTRMRLEVAKL